MATADQPNPAKKPSGQSFQAPRGTRDFYPIEMARRLWLEDKWRRTAVRHGFDEIDGPTFEHLDLYTVKSGEGIVNELFSFTRAGGETPFALRPEFTPTLARMVATKANALPKPIKWFSIGPYFRAERPQRGRLREFLQWNVDVLGDPSPEADAEAIACCVDSLLATGLDHEEVRIHINHRGVFQWLAGLNLEPEKFVAWVALLDRRDRLEVGEIKRQAADIGVEPHVVDHMIGQFNRTISGDSTWHQVLEYYGVPDDEPNHDDFKPSEIPPMQRLETLHRLLRASALAKYCVFDVGLARGLAYYTGTVFEVHETTGAERAIAGGGRYDNLVELFGGPPTPAVGFAMGDVVISLVLQDKGLMPSDNDIARDLGLQPDAFVFAANDEADAVALRPLLAHLRREGLHARRSYKSTRNIGKLLQDADKCAARYAVILESATSAKVKDLGAATRTDGEPVTGAGPAALAQAIAAKIPPK